MLPKAVSMAPAHGKCSKNGKWQLAGAFDGKLDNLDL